MYSAYQSGPFGSACPIRASCCPCAAAAQRLRQGASGRVRRVAGDTARKPGRDLLQQPAVAVGIAREASLACYEPLKWFTGGLKTSQLRLGHKDGDESIGRWYWQYFAISRRAEQRYG
jgi:hypothetical protein